MQVSFEIVGKAAPAGSKKGFVRGGHVSVVDASERTKPWQALVQDRAIEAMQAGGIDLIEGPVVTSFLFVEPRPQSHYNSKGELNKLGQSKPFPTKKPDALKLARAVEDALSGIVYKDDSLVVLGKQAKVYGPRDYTVVYVSDEIPPFLKEVLDDSDQGGSPDSPGVDRQDRDGSDHQAEGGVGG